ncbi:protein tumorous imaginal discs, mitochondrial [Musca vetustissima]|uniref:protein tumorous imaginal discs, mitochondrial n=1 Tax=Musca vetustissima TaxID=27455 RepID=UPI002AB7B8C0|nr:protein tumorous imaginal discs, mitochondrial [Musca vetustissima]
MKHLIKITYLYPNQLKQNFGIIQKVHLATAAYQFKVERPIYYPDRRNEKLRIDGQQKSELITESKQPKQLPKDYYYKVLGLQRQATTQEIKAAYYALAKRFHPDSTNFKDNKEISKRFEEISNAYHILTDETKRLEYDQLGQVRDEEQFLNNMNTKNHGKEYTIKIPNVLKSFKDLTASKATSIPTMTAPSINDDIRHFVNSEQKLDITFLESVHGVKRNIDLKYLIKCPQCNGNSLRMAGRTSVEPCRKCNGYGQLKKKTATYTAVSVCDQCNGKRFVNRNQCDLCECRGFVQESNRITIHIPAGVKTGDVMSVENSKNGQRLSYRIQVQESDYYHRIGNNVVTEKYVNLTEAILGGTVKVRGIYENLDLKIEPGTESHTKITLKGKGIRSRGDGAGDHIVVIKIRIPRNLTMKQRQLILALSKTENPTFDGTI